MLHIENHEIDHYNMISCDEYHIYEDRKYYQNLFHTRKIHTQGQLRVVNTCTHTVRLYRDTQNNVGSLLLTVFCLEVRDKLLIVVWNLS